MLLEQVLHIMLNQEYPRFFVYVFFRPQKYIFLHYAILWEMENMRKNYANVCKAIFIQN